MSKELTELFTFPFDEKVIGICNYQDKVIIATDRRLYSAEHLEDEVLMVVRVVDCVTVCQIKEG